MSIKTPPDVLRVLATDEDEGIRSAALMNACFPADTLWEHLPAGEGEEASEEWSGEGEPSYRALGYEGAEDPLDIDEEDEAYFDELSAAHEEALWEDQQRSHDDYDYDYDYGDDWATTTRWTLTTYTQPGVHRHRPRSFSASRAFATDPFDPPCLRTETLLPRRSKGWRPTLKRAFDPASRPTRWRRSRFGGSSPKIATRQSEAHSRVILERPPNFFGASDATRQHRLRRSLQTTQTPHRLRSKPSRVAPSES